MFHGEIQLLLFDTPTCQAHAQRNTPYGLVLRDDILEHRTLVVADRVALVIKYDKSCRFLSQRRTQRRFFNLHFVLPCHTNFDAVVSSRKQMLPFCCQRPTGVAEIFKCGSEEAEHLALVDVRTYAETCAHQLTLNSVHNQRN